MDITYKYFNTIKSGDVHIIPGLFSAVSKLQWGSLVGNVNMFGKLSIDYLLVKPAPSTHQKKKNLATALQQAPALAPMKRYLTFGLTTFLNLQPR